MAQRGTREQREEQRHKNDVNMSFNLILNCHSVSTHINSFQESKSVSCHSLKPVISIILPYFIIMTLVTVSETALNQGAL